MRRMREELSNEGTFSNPTELLENPILFENPLSQGVKVGIGIGAVAALGVGAYFLLRPKAAPAPVATNTPSSGGTPGGQPPSDGGLPASGDNPGQLAGYNRNGASLADILGKCANGWEYVIVPGQTCPSGDGPCHVGPIPVGTNDLVGTWGPIALHQLGPPLAARLQTFGPAFDPTQLGAVRVYRNAQATLIQITIRQHYNVEFVCFHQVTRTPQTPYRMSGSTMFPPVGTGAAPAPTHTLPLGVQRNTWTCMPAVPAPTFPPDFCTPPNQCDPLGQCPEIFPSLPSSMFWSRGGACPPQSGPCTTDYYGQVIMSENPHLILAPDSYKVVKDRSGYNWGVLTYSSLGIVLVTCGANGTCAATVWSYKKQARTVMQPSRKVVEPHPTGVGAQSQPAAHTPHLAPPIIKRNCPPGSVWDYRTNQCVLSAPTPPGASHMAHLMTGGMMSTPVGVGYAVRGGASLADVVGQCGTGWQYVIAPGQACPAGAGACYVSSAGSIPVAGNNLVGEWGPLVPFSQLGPTLASRLQFLGFSGAQGAVRVYRNAQATLVQIAYAQRYTVMFICFHYVIKTPVAPHLMTGGMMSTPVGVGQHQQNQAPVDHTSRHGTQSTVHPHSEMIPLAQKAHLGQSDGSVGAQARSSPWPSILGCNRWAELQVVVASPESAYHLSTWQGTLAQLSAISPTLAASVIGKTLVAAGPGGSLDPNGAKSTASKDLNVIVGAFGSLETYRSGGRASQVRITPSSWETGVGQQMYFVVGGGLSPSITFACEVQEVVKSGGVHTKAHLGQSDGSVGAMSRIAQPVPNVNAPGPYTVVPGRIGTESPVVGGRTYLTSSPPERNWSLAQIVTALTTEGWQVLQAWDVGQVPANWPASDLDQTRRRFVLVPPGHAGWWSGGGPVFQAGYYESIHARSTPRITGEPFPMHVGTR